MEAVVCPPSMAVAMQGALEKFSQHTESLTVRLANAALTAMEEGELCLGASARILHSESSEICRWQEAVALLADLQLARLRPDTRGTLLTVAKCPTLDTSSSVKVLQKLSVLSRCEQRSKCSCPGCGLASPDRIGIAAMKVDAWESAMLSRGTSLHLLQRTHCVPKPELRGLQASELSPKAASLLSAGQRPTRRAGTSWVPTWRWRRSARAATGARA